MDTKDVLGTQEARVFAKVGSDVGTITGWRWDGSRYVEVPFQVDEVFTRYLDNSSSGFAIYSGQDQHTTYAFEREGFRWTKGECIATPDSPVEKDPVPGLDTDDELVFMAADTGPAAPSGAPLPPGVTDVKKVTVIDPLTRNSGYLYVMLGRTPSFTAANGYVSYERDADANAFEKSQSSYSDYGNAAVGHLLRRRRQRDRYRPSPSQGHRHGHHRPLPLPLRRPVAHDRRPHQPGRWRDVRPRPRRPLEGPRLPAGRRVRDPLLRLRGGGHQLGWFLDPARREGRPGPRHP